MVIKRKLYRIKLTRSLSYKVLSEGKYNIFNIVFPTRHPVDKDSIFDWSQAFTLVPHFMEKKWNIPSVTTKLHINIWLVLAEIVMVCNYSISSWNIPRTSSMDPNSMTILCRLCCSKTSSLGMFGYDVG